MKLYNIKSVINKINCRKNAVIIKDKKIYKKDIDPSLFLEIINKKQTGIYSQYFDKKHRKRDNWFCGYMCIDIDLHGKLYTAENLKRAQDLLTIIKSKSDDYLFLSEKYIYIERTKHGFHLWLFFEKNILQKYILYYIKIIENNITVKFKEIFGDNYIVEFFPKGENHIGGYGAAVFLHDLPVNKKPNKIHKISKNKIKDIVNSAKKLNYDSVRKRGNKKKIKIKKTTNKIEKNDTTELLERYCRTVGARKCIVNVLKGRVKLHGTNGNTMRVRIVQELANLGYTAKQIVPAFYYQSDFNTTKTLYHVKKCIENGYPFPSCESIRRTGYCDPTCWMNGATMEEESPSFNSDEFKRNYPVLGWREKKSDKPTLFEKLKKIIGDNKSYFINKTTRSGTTSGVIIEALKQKKKILMIAPTYKIFDKTVKKAIEIGRMNGDFDFSDGFTTYIPKNYKILSNVDLCKKIEYSEDKMASVFPFLLKPPCEKCKEEECDFRNFRENMDKHNIIFLTTQKLHVLVEIAEKSKEARELLREIQEWSDIIFIDECYQLFEINFKEMVIYSNNINKIEKISNDILYFESIFRSNPFFKDLKRFLDNIYNIVDNMLEGEKEAKIINISEDKSWFEVLFDDSEDWSKQYGAFINLFKKNKDMDISDIVEIFLALSCKDLYIQQRITQYGERIISLISVNNIKKFISFLSKIRKKLLVTDAVKPPIPLNKIFKDIKICNINDPMKSAEKQKIVVVSESDPFYTFGSSSIPFTEKNKKRLIEYINNIKELKGKEIFIVTQSKEYNQKLSFILKENDLKEFKRDIKKRTYHRSDETIGVASKIRNMVCIGSSHTPRHVYDIPALIYIKLGIVDIDKKKYTIFGKYLENHNAMSAFFQTISRVKDPKGKEKSTVYIFGTKYREIKKWFEELKISVPNLYFKTF